MASADERYDAAFALQQEGKLDDAIAAMKQLAEEDPQFALAHSALAVWLGQQEAHQEAVAHAQKVCELEGDDPFSFVALSLVCQKAGMIAEAEDALMRARQAQG